VIGYWLLVIGYLLLVICYWLFVGYCFARHSFSEGGVIVLSTEALSLTLHSFSDGAAKVELLVTGC